MTQATVERIESDPWLAHAFVERARRFLEDGSAKQMGPESRHLLLHNAAIAACDAILAINGRRVVGSDGGHRLRLTTAQAILSGAPEDLFAQLDDLRMTRNEASYGTGLIPPPTTDEAMVAVRELVELVAAHVTPRLPPYLNEDG